MSSLLVSYVALALLAALMAYMEVPSLLQAGDAKELWAFIGISALAFALLAIVAASVSFSGINEHVVLMLKPYMDPLIQPPPQ